MSSEPFNAHLLVNGQPVVVPAEHTTMSLLDFLREERSLRGTKEGCASGDCGACTVIIQRDGQPHTLNSCITPVGSVVGDQITTIEGIGSPTELHPVQAEMVAHHGSQCGFCTPGFVCSMVGFQAACNDHPHDASEDALTTAISGNLCRCTGYRPILSAFAAANRQGTTELPSATFEVLPPPDNLHRPESRETLRQLLGRDASLVAGATDLWLEHTQQLRDFPALIDVTRIAELSEVRLEGGRLRIGASTTHQRLEDTFAERLSSPPILRLLHRFGSPQIRARGTIGGNLANGSPIADWPPVLMIGDGWIELDNARGETRRLPLHEFFVGYRETALRADEYIVAVDVDAQMDWQAVTIEKISKRWDDDISTVLGAFHIQMDGQIIRDCRVAYGGVAATPVRLFELEQTLIGATLGTQTHRAGEDVVRQTLKPLSDVRASAAYRMEMAVELLHMALRRAEGEEPIQLEGFG